MESDGSSDPSEQLKNIFYRGHSPHMSLYEEPDQKSIPIGTENEESKLPGAKIAPEVQYCTQID